MTFDGKAFGRDIVEAVKGHVATALGPIVVRLAVIEQREPLKGEKGEPGEAGPIGPAGKDADPNELTRLLVPEVERAVAMLPKAEKGADGRDGKDGEPGKDADPGVIARMVEVDVMKAVAGLPKPEIGFAPDDIVEHVLAAVHLLAESPPIVAAAKVVPILPPKTKIKEVEMPDGRIATIREYDEERA